MLLSSVYKTLFPISICVKFLFSVTMTDAYGTLDGQREETPEEYDDQLLENLNNDKGRMSATKYVAGYMTYKVFWSSFLHYTNLSIMTIDFSSALNLGRWRMETSLHSRVMEA